MSNQRVANRRRVKPANLSKAKEASTSRAKATKSKRVKVASTGGDNPQHHGHDVSKRRTLCGRLIHHLFRSWPVSELGLLQLYSWFLKLAARRVTVLAILP